MAAWNVGRLPFVYAPQKTASNNKLPDTLPFSIGVDEELGHIVQIYDSEVEGVLKRAYASGSMLSGLMDETGIGLKYTEDFLAFVHNHRGRDLNGCTVLDIGCGTGYFLSRLHRDGADVTGIEPGAHGQDGAARFNVPVVRDFFPSSRVTRTFHAITAFGVLEHIRELQGFLEAIKSQLAVNGAIFLAVPDCEPYLESGDISFFFHEHWNYFTRRTLRAVLRRALGFEVVVERSGFGGCLYAFIQSDIPVRLNADDDMKAAGRQFGTFQTRAKRHLRVFSEFLMDAGKKGEMLGIFVPGRIVNLLSLNLSRIGCNQIRFFDDNPILQGTYYPGIPIQVESRPDLLNRPPDRLLIVSRTFGETIADSLRRDGYSKAIITWKDIFHLG